jgi:hypothetical protein
MPTSTQRHTALASDRFRVGDFLPEALRASSTETNVLLCTHAEDCELCRAFVARLDATHEEFRIWDARLRVVRGTTPEPSLVIADRYGHIFYVFESNGDHNLPSPSVVAEALKFLGTLCPE